MPNVMEMADLLDLQHQRVVHTNDLKDQILKAIIKYTSLLCSQVEKPEEGF